jgi:hypothetical protein
VPTRYAVEGAGPAFKNNWLLSTIAFQALAKTYGGMTKFISNPGNLQDGIERARKARAASLSERNTFSVQTIYIVRIEQAVLCL